MRMIMLPIALTVSFATACGANEAKKPPEPPAVTVPDLRDVDAKLLCAGCEDPFDATTHKKLIEQAVKSPYLNELRRALYWQDSVHQFQSKAHFDNCDFEGAMEYVEELMTEAGAHVSSAADAKLKKDKRAMTESAGKAFFALGQAMHAVQDFYAHTNYVELIAASATRIDDLKIVAPWRTSGRDAVLTWQRTDGLFSGFVFWGLPQKCPANTPSHGALAKDKATTKSGQVKIPHLRNHSRYEIAAMLARLASQELLTDAFRRWPLLAELNGPAVLVEVMVDGRAVDESNE